MLGLTQMTSQSFGCFLSRHKKPESFIRFLAQGLVEEDTKLCLVALFMMETGRVGFGLEITKKQVGRDDKRAAVHEEMKRMSSLPANSSYAAHRLRVLKKIILYLFREPRHRTKSWNCFLRDFISKVIFCCVVQCQDI